MKNHDVTITISRKKFQYDQHCVHVERGDKITWKLTNAAPFAVIVKEFVSPLDWSFEVLGPRRKTIAGVVRNDAKPGFHPYSVCVLDGGDLLVDDPEIIVKPPKGGK